MIKGLIFDLDNCVFDTGSMGKKIINPVLKVLKNNNIKLFDKL